MVLLKQVVHCLGLNRPKVTLVGTVSLDTSSVLSGPSGSKSLVFLNVNGLAPESMFIKASLLSGLLRSRRRASAKRDSGPL